MRSLLWICDVRFLHPSLPEIKALKRFLLWSGPSASDYGKVRISCKPTLSEIALVCNLTSAGGSGLASTTCKLGTKNRRVSKFRVRIGLSFRFRKRKVR